ncbi:MAG: DUF624 domain-containing protein [Clostridiales bacterium]|nr:DUF624 domain-containing protein [Clostridiales bacterium]
MFGRMMNNYFYGKSGKGDFRRDDLPETRWQLFRDTLRTRLSGICRLSLLYSLIWLPAMIIIFIFGSRFYTTMNDIALSEATYPEYVQWAESNEITATTEEEFYQSASYVALTTRNYERYAQLNEGVSREEFLELAQSVPTLRKQTDERIIIPMLVWLFIAIGITGPFTAGISYVTRNWARDEHAFIWSDFKDALKSNWKYSLVLSLITGFMPLAVYVGYDYYGSMSSQSLFMIVPQVLVAVVGVIWSFSITYMHPLTVTYDLKLKDVMRNGIILGIARLPMSVGIRLLHCVPLLIAAAAVLLFNVDMMLGLVILGAYYCVIGFGLSRFITASYTNAVFDRFINTRIEGAKVNQGLREKDDDEETGDGADDGEPEEERQPDGKD